MKLTHFTMPLSKTPVVGKTLTGQELYLGGLSGLSFIEKKDEKFYFYANTDRGPNGWNEGKERPFLVPEISPQIAKVSADPHTNTLEVIDILLLKKKNGKPLTGLPNSREEENPIDQNGFMYSIDEDGLDTESMAQDGAGGFWIGEEYAPSLVHFNKDGKMISRLTPGRELPKTYRERKPNRGFEGVALLGRKLYGILQSPLPHEKNEGSRIVEVDLDSMKTSSEYFYPFEKGNDKIGDMAPLGNNALLVIEQNGKVGKESSKLVYKITFNGPDQAVQKTLVADLKNTPFNDVEKVEGLTVINSHSIALTYDNDFQISGKTDREKGVTPLNKLENQLIIIEFKEALY